MSQTLTRPGPGCGLPAPQERYQAPAVEGASVGDFDPAQVEQGRHEIDVAGQRVDVAAAGDAPVGVADEERHAVAAFVRRAFPAAHSGVAASLPFEGELAGIEVDSGGGAVVGHEDEDGVAGDSRLVERGLQAAEVLVDVGDHAVEAGALLVRGGAAVRLDVVRLDVERSVRRVGGDVTEEGPVRVFFDEAPALAEEHVRAVPLVLRGDAVPEVGVVEVVVAPGVPRVADAAARVVDGFAKAALVRPVGRAVAEVPLAEVPGAVAGPGKRVSEGPLVGAQQRAAADGVPDAGAVAEMAGEQAGAGGGAGGADVVVGEAYRVPVEAVEAGRADRAVAVAAEVAVPLVVGEDEDDVGTRSHGHLPLLFILKWQLRKKQEGNSHENRRRRTHVPGRSFHAAHQRTHAVLAAALGASSRSAK